MLPSSPTAFSYASPISSFVSFSPHTCRYPSKPCDNPRAMKRNGDLHSLCDYHRAKANTNQRRMEQRRRALKQMQPSHILTKGIRPVNPHTIIMKKTVLAGNHGSQKTPKETQAYVMPHMRFTDLLMTDLATNIIPGHENFPIVDLNIKVPQSATELLENVLESDIDLLFNCIDSLPLSGSETA